MKQDPIVGARLPLSKNSSAAAYAPGRISMARAAQEAEVSSWEFHTYLREHKAAAQYDLQESEHDLETIAGRR